MSGCLSGCGGRRLGGGNDPNSVSCVDDPNTQGQWLCGKNDKSGDSFTVTKEDVGKVITNVGNGNYALTKSAVPKSKSPSSTGNFLSNVSPTTIALGGIGLLSVLAIAGGR